MASIQSVLNENFLKRLSAIKKGESREGAAINKILSGGNREDAVITSIKAGSQLYARALTGLNFGISFLNFARSDLERISELTDEMVLAMDKAASPVGSKNDRLKAQRVIEDLGSEVKAIIKDAEVGDRRYLTGLGLRGVFAAIGLDSEKAREVDKIFDSFTSVDKEETLSDLNVKGDNSPIPKELGKASTSHESSPLFDGSRSLTKAADAYAMMDDLKAFSNQVKENLGVIDQLGELLQENALLVRTTAIAFIEIQDEIKTAPQAADVARDLQRRILRDARAALSQAENLEPLVVATLSYEDNGVVLES